ncbi:MAG: CHAT domain-containing protein, partial [Candidatus Eisenbacteria bacterium]
RVGAKALSRARACARAAGSAFLGFRVACLEGDAAVARGDRAGARRAYGRARRLSETTAARVRGELFRATDWSAWEEAYPRVVALEVASGRVAAVFRELEGARQRAFDAVSAGQSPGRARSDSALERRLRVLSCRLEARGRVRAPLGPAPGLMAVDVQAELRAVGRDLERRERRQAARRARPAASSSLRLDAQRARLGHGTLALEWFETDRGAGVLALDRAGAAVFDRLARPGELAAWADEIRYHARGAAGGDPASARAMEDLLAVVREALLAAPLSWARERRGAPPDDLVVVPAGALVAFPWPALAPAPVSVVPSLAFALRAAPSRPRGRTLLVGLGGDDLPGVRHEIDALSRLVPRARVLFGREATVDRLARELAAGVDWLHVAGHGRHDEDRPVLSGLRLADRWAHLPDLAPRGRSPRVVVLTACRSGEIAGAFRNEWQGLPGGLLRAGTRTLLASLWEVEDAAARAMSLGIHRRLLRGNTLGEAVQSAGTALGGGSPGRWNAWTWGLFGRADARFPGN